MKRLLLLFALLMLAAAPTLVQVETPDECAARLDANVRVNTIAEAIDWLDRVMSECLPDETPAAEAAAAAPATVTADDQCIMMYLWNNGLGWGWIRSGTNPADAGERLGRLYVGDSICATGEVVEWVGKDSGDWQQVIYEGEVAYVFNQWLRDMPQAPTATPIPTITPSPTPTAADMPDPPTSDGETNAVQPESGISPSEVQQWADIAHLMKLEMRQRRSHAQSYCSQSSRYMQAIRELQRLCDRGSAAACTAYEVNAGEQVESESDC